MSGDVKAGAVAALETVGAGVAPADEAEQLTLVDALGLPALLPEGEATLRAQLPRKAGRPPGARNKRTEEWVEFLLKAHTSPLIMLLQIANAPVVELMKRLGCTALEALQEKRHAAIAAAPYLHQRLPQAIEVKNPEGLGIMFILPGQVPEDALGEGSVLVPMIEAKVAEKRDKSAGVGGPSSEEKPNGEVHQSLAWSAPLIAKKKPEGAA
jgi:hypothetical protein